MSHTIIAGAGFSCRNILTNSSNVYSRPLQSITVYSFIVLHDSRNYSAGSQHPLQSTAIPHIIRG